ncbi:hypothetical protein CJ030_MR1G014037 [Morella rubra]|uniref:Uncharacterized protein n=1 Tax=Morella rubra TaxID=262757 RepID=A0A6A1VNX1_9ROSI|nr:hypothetical protein CJ030_MR5G002485 [Morella rubra]KAB1226305.1 hypothetical protein CJ030_MR1G014037 [Morella rubra]
MESRRSFRLRGGSSFRLVRSYSSVLTSETITAECAGITGYERLSESRRLIDEYNIGTERKKAKDWWLLGKVFSFRKLPGDVQARKGSEKVVEEKQAKKKKRPSWLPTPERRWPVQGW